jgi:hypothetical protein
LKASAGAINLAACGIFDGTTPPAVGRDVGSSAAVARVSSWLQRDCPPASAAKSTLKGNENSEFEKTLSKKTKINKHNNKDELRF